jgi:hypothetical protein
MSATNEIVCGRCGGSNHLASTRCWVCYSPLAAETAGGEGPAPTLKVAPRQNAHNPWVTALKIVLVLSFIMAMVPVLLFITCVGIIAVGSSGHF